MDLIALVNDSEKFQKHFDEELSKYTPRQIAYYFTHGFSNVDVLLNTPSIENQRMLIKNFLSQQSLEYNNQFKQHLDDPLLGKRKGDDLFD